jgi:site-specific DNA recombinase
MMLTLLASLAQEESLSVSENCKWKIRKNFESGLPMTTPLTGYYIRKGVFTAIPEEASLVEMIFRAYAEGEGRNAIQRKLTGMGVRSHLGGEWTDAHLRELLRNEKYVGDLMMQKYFRRNSLSKKDVKNEGELPRYFVQNHHAPLIDRETFQRVQQRMDVQHERYAGLGGKRGAFSGMIRCVQCGKSYKRKTTHGKAAWQCSTFITLGKRYCHTKQIPEDVLIAVTTSVLGLQEFDEGSFREQIERIEVPAFNRLVYVFKDGRREERVWQDKSRRDSWTAEMRQKASERAERRDSK